MAINWQYYPKYSRIPEHLVDVVKIFESHGEKIESPNKGLSSNQVLSILRSDLSEKGFDVEKSKLSGDKVQVPVLFGRSGKFEKHFDADAVNNNTRTVIEVEAGGGVENYKFLKDLFQACVMQDIDYLIVAVMNTYHFGKGKKRPHFEIVVKFLEALYASNRLNLPLKGILIIGY